MSGEQWLAFALFAFASSITPGPNNLMLLASGVNFGLRRTLPHLLGVCAGFVLLLLAVGLGLAGLFQHWPAAYTALKGVGAAYLLYLAWAVARAGSPAPREAAQPLGFWGAAAFQWVNVKAWMMGVTAFSAYAGASSWAGVLSVTVVFALVNLPCLTTWTLLGSRLRHWMRQGRRQRNFNRTMALLLVASLLPMLV